MRRAISIVLAAILVTTPLKMVLAQAAQQEAVSVQQTVPPDSSGHRLIGVPPVTDNTSRLWQPFAAENPPGNFVESSLSTKDAVDGWSDWPKWRKVLLVVLSVILVFSTVAMAIIVDGISDEGGDE